MITSHKYTARIANHRHQVKVPDEASFIIAMAKLGRSTMSSPRQRGGRDGEFNKPRRCGFVDGVRAAFQ